MSGRYRIYAFALSALAIFGCAHGASNTPSETTGESTVAETKEQEVEYSDGSTTLKGFIAYPTASGPRPAIMVVHEWWGLNDYIRSRARKLADMGYVAMAVDMYGNGKTADHPQDAQKFMMEVMGNLAVGIKRFQAAKQLLQKDARVDPDKIAAIGYCFGGAVSLHMARRGEDLDLVASFHGNLSTQKPMEPGIFKGKIFVAHGAADPFVPPEQVAAFRKEMDEAGANYEFVAYEGAVHAFTNPEATDNGQKFNLPLAYDAAADQASWQKLTELLEATWGKPGA